MPDNEKEFKKIYSMVPAPKKASGQNLRALCLMM